MNFKRLRMRDYKGIQLGNGSKTISQSGCLLCCLTMAREIFSRREAREGVEVNVDTVKVNEFLRANDCFAGSGLLVREACNLLAMRYNGRSARESFDGICKAVAGGALVILGIDYKKGKSSGLSDADHFILAHSFINGKLICADATYGKDTEIESLQIQYNNAPATICEATFLSQITIH